MNMKVSLTTNLQIKCYDEASPMISCKIFLYLIDNAFKLKIYNNIGMVIRRCIEQLELDLVVRVSFHSTTELIQD